MYIHTFIWGGPVSIQVIQSEPGTYIDFGAWERIFFFMEMKITGWSLKFYECLLCMERHSRNRRWLAEFSSEKEEVELVDLPRTAQPPSGRRYRIWAFRQGQGREALLGKGVPSFVPSSEELSCQGRLRQPGFLHLGGTGRL